MRQTVISTNRTKTNLNSINWDSPISFFLNTLKWYKRRRGNRNWRESWIRKGETEYPPKGVKGKKIGEFGYGTKDERKTEEKKKKMNIVKENNNQTERKPGKMKSVKGRRRWWWRC